MTNNIRNIHKSCAEERLNVFQDRNPKISLKGVQYVKRSFKGDKEKSEHMWVRVVKHDDTKKTFEGFLASEPVFIASEKLYEGCIVSGEYSQICEVYNED